MQNLRSSLLVAVVFLAPLVARADAPSRAARLLTLGPDVVAVLVAPDRAWFPGGSAPLALCVGDRCAPVARVESCAPPQCPGTGSVAVAERAVADVGGFPTDRQGFTREIERLHADPALVSLAPYFGAHPEGPPPPPEPARFLVDSHRGFSWELDALAIGGGLAATGVPLVGGEVGGGFRFTWVPHNDDDEFIMVVFGNSMGADLRVRALGLFPSQSASVWGVTIGLAPAMGVAPEGEGFRLPSVYSSILPEFGVVVREDVAPAWYVGWTLPFTFLFDVHYGLELRASVLLVDDWVVGDDVEALVALGAGIVFR